MKILHRDSKKNEIKVRIENIDDLWHLYNILLPSDKAYAKTYRRIRKEEEGARPDQGERIKVFLGIEVESFEFHAFSTRLRVKGKIVFGPEDLVGLHGYHTLNIEPGTELTIVKNEWTPYFLKRLDRALKSSTTPEFLIIAIDKGDACLAAVSDTGVRVLTEFSENIPGKRYNVSYHDKALNEFFTSLLQHTMEHVERDEIKFILIGGPGSVKDQFLKFMKKKVPKFEGTVLLEDASGGTKSGIYEIIRKGKIAQQVDEFRIGQENDLMDELLSRIGQDKSDVAYGLSDVERAIEHGAVESLLLTDTRFREGSIEDRKKIEKLIMSLEKAGGRVVFVSIHHPAGEQLEKLGGIAALLRFAI